MYNGVCDVSNNIAACRYDGFDCCQTQDFEPELWVNCPLDDEICDFGLLKNGQCDDYNNNGDCAYDMGACKTQVDIKEAYVCLKSMYLRGDGLCDQLNSITACDFDQDDCLPHKGIICSSVSP
jgi:hypothetical protein